MKGKIFNTQEAQAIIAGNKTMFREVIKPQPDGELATSYQKYSDVFCFMDKFGGVQTVKCPYQVRQKIFCKERFARDFDSEGNAIAILEADGKQERRWKPAQHMKQEHSRLTLLIKEIKVERLGEISEKDCVKEGIECYDESGMLHVGYISEKDAFEVVWNATHKKPEEKFEASPFVWVISCEVVK